MAKYKPKYVTVNKPGKAPEYKSTAQAPAEFQIGTYSSKYGDQLDSSLNTITNWNYDPMQDASYQALAKVYGKRGNEAAKNTLADAASLNGGYGTSYAVSAAQQARNQYNQELAALIPDLEQNAFNRAQVTYNALRDADDTDYNRFRDTEGDRQWQWTQNYNAYRDKVGDEQWLYSQNYQKYQDALSQYQWALDYNNALYAQKKTTGGSGGGGRRSGGGGGGYSSAGGSSGSSSVSSAPKLSTAKAWGGAYGADKAGGKQYAYSTGTGKTKVTIADFQKKVSKKK